MNFINRLNKNSIQYYKFEYIFQTGMWRNKLVNKYNCDSKILVVGHDDTSFTNNIYYYLKQQSNILKYIFAINCDNTNSNCYNLPLGITNDCDDSDIHIYGNIQMMLDISREKITKDKLVYLNVNPQTHSMRKAIIDKFKDKSYVTYEQPTNTMIGRKDFLRKIKQHYFIPFASSVFLINNCSVGVISTSA